MGKAVVRSGRLPDRVKVRRVRALPYSFPLQEFQLKNTLTHFVGECTFIARTIVGRDDEEICGPGL